MADASIGLLSTITTMPVPLRMIAGAITCGLIGASGKFIGRRPQSKAQKHDQIHSMPEAKLNTIADHISTALTDDKISDEEFRLILSEVDKYDQMRAEIRWRQEKSLSNDEKETSKARERQGDDDGPYQVVERVPPSG